MTVHPVVSIVFLIGASAVHLSGCVHGRGDSEAPMQAQAEMEGKSGHKIQGTVNFLQKDEDEVKVIVNLNGLKPNSTHGIHIHEKGNCFGSQAQNTGDHFSPEGRQHGDLNDEDAHAGDLGNVESDDRGKVWKEFVVKRITLKENRNNSISGRSVVLHSREDDLSSQPSGDSGAKIACGVVL